MKNISQLRAISYSYLARKHKKCLAEIEKAKNEGLAFSISRYDEVTMRHIKEARQATENGKKGG